MKYYHAMREEEFLDYVETHSKTERALFRKDMVAQMLLLAGYDERAKEIYNNFKQWYGIDMSDLVKEARERFSEENPNLVETIKP